ncbi:hypothetical protein FIU83_12645 [Halomonas sp. THAF5a]|uniref:hypothetical protein n=1 Tax=Halomonas sp. THAF5a TaxID=2587844 RepID=UPI0012680C52|nr:hypothetical protein [Halomonas sp. THAF5a]QFU02483.1 hypothetical protein FIU83_12645 [Halomonas sp. THAF5a]
MKINVEFDLTPEEFRQALGLPNVEAFQKDLLDRIQKQMESGVEGYDPMSLMQPFLQQQGLSQNLTQGLSQGLSSFGNYQQMMLDMLSRAAASAGSGEATDEAASGEASSSTRKSSTGKASSRAASARSRAKREG